LSQSDGHTSEAFGGAVGYTGWRHRGRSGCASSTPEDVENPLAAEEGAPQPTEAPEGLRVLLKSTVYFLNSTVCNLKTLNLTCTGSAT
jgi:hypothetical protein